MNKLVITLISFILASCVSQYQVQGTTSESPLLKFSAVLKYGSSIEYSVLNDPCVTNESARIAFLGILGKEAETQILENEKLTIKATYGIHSSSSTRMLISYFEFTPEISKTYNLHYENGSYKLTENISDEVPSSYKRLRTDFCTQRKNV